MTVLSPLVLDFLWEDLAAGDLPYPLEMRSHGETLEERGVLRERIYGELRQHGMVDDRGGIEPRLADWLTVLAKAEHSIDSVFLAEAEGPSVTALAARAGNTALLATQDAKPSSGLRLWQISPDSLVSTIIGMLPAAKRGTEPSITLPTEELTQLSAGRMPDITADDREALRRLSDQEKLRAGQLAANARGRLGSRARSAVLSWFDTESGRYLTYANRGADGREWVTIAPADAPTLRHRLGQLLGSAASRV